MMAFGITKRELLNWKTKVNRGEIAFLTHYWLDERFPHATTVTKVGCNSIHTLAQWGDKYHLKKDWIHYTKYPHFDLFGEKQKEILLCENQYDHIKRFNL